MADLAVLFAAIWTGRGIGVASGARISARVGAFLLAMVAVAASARAENPIEFFQRMAEPTLQELRGTAPPAPRAPVITQAPDAPLLSVPMPRLRPDDGPDAAPDTALGFMPSPGAVIEAMPTEDMPSPRLRPTLGPANVAFTPAPPPAVPPDTAVTASLPTFAPPRGGPLLPLDQLPEPPPAARMTCGVSLAMLGVTAVAMDNIAEGQCGVTAPVEMASLDGGAIDISGEAVVACHLAETFAGWMEDTVEPLARAKLGGEIIGVRVAAGYACRNRNNLADTKLSEHAKGNAIDISAFEVEGRGWVAVGQTEGVEDEFIAAVRKSACGPFKTVLGPGSDAYHSDHLHIDLAQRRNGSAYCR